MPMIHKKSWPRNWKHYQFRYMYWIFWTCTSNGNSRKSAHKNEVLDCISFFFNILDSINSNKKEISRTHREIALWRWNPEIGTAGIKYDTEILWGRANTNLSKVLSIHKVLQRQYIFIWITQTMAHATNTCSPHISLFSCYSCSI